MHSRRFLRVFAVGTAECLVMAPSLNDWLEQIGLGRYVAAFEANDIDFDVLSHLSDEDLLALGLSLGHRRKLQAALSRFAEGQDAGLLHAQGGDGAITDTLVRPQAAFAERKLATLLFADVVDSTALIGDLDIEHAADMLGLAVRLMTEAVHRYDGTVNKVQGDGIMAIFGAPRAYEDHATRACYAAYEMREAIAARTELGIQIRAGLNSGEVLVRGVQVDLTHEYDAIGPAVHLAGRMEQLAGPGEIFLSETTAQLAAGMVEVEPQGQLEVRGLSEHVSVFSLTATSGNWSRWALRASRELTPFVNRQAESETLIRYAQRAARGEGQVISLVAEAGTGKSRLVYEFSRVLRKQGWFVWSADTSPVIRASPYLPIARLLRGLFRIREKDDPVRVAARLRKGLAALSKDLLVHTPALLFLLGGQGGGAEWQALDGKERQRRIAAALRHCILLWAQRHRTVIVLEDLQWADGETLAVAEEIIGALSGAPLLLLLTYRPDFHPPWQQRSYCHALRLNGLNNSDADEMMTRLLGQDPSLESLRPRLLQRSEGRPLFIEETVRALIETGVVASESNGYRLMAEDGEIEIPTTVQAVIAERIDALPSDRKYLLQCASVIGRSFPRKLLQDLGGWDAARLRRLLTELEAQEFLFQSEVFPEPTYAFKHVLNREVAYGSLPRASRKELHARLVRLIESADYYKREDRLERLGHHAFSAEQWQEAAAYLMKAAERAFDQSAHQESVMLLERALQALSHLPESQKVLETQIDAHMRMRAAYGALAQLAENRNQLAEAKRLAERMDDRTQLARIATHECILDYLHGDIRDAIVSGENAVALAEAARDPGLRLVAHLFLGIAHRFRGESAQSSALLRRCLSECLETPERRHGAAGTTAVLYLANLAQSTANQGLFEDSQRFAEQACELAHRIRRPFDIGIAERVYGHSLLMRGEAAAAIPYLERGLHAVRDADIQIFIPYNASFLAFAYGLTGRLEDARWLIEEALEQLLAGGFTSYRAFPLVYRAKFLLMQGKLEHAQTAAQAALSYAHDGGYLAAEASALAVSGDIAGKTGDDAEAEALLGQAVALFETLGFQPGLARALHAMAKLQRRLGRDEPAREFADRASHLWREMSLASPCE